MKEKKEKISQLALSNRCVETQAQIQNVLQVMAMTSSALSQFARSPFSFLHTDSGDAPKDPPPMKMTEAQIALEKTLWAACSRMEQILGDDARWSDEFQRKIEKEYDELHALQMAAVEKQHRAAAEVTSPHFRYRPDLHRLRDGRWMAILGDVQHLEFAVYGIGDSAQQAIEEFDCVFLKGVPKSVLLWSQKREEALNNDRPHDEPFPNSEQTNDTHDENKPLDSPGNRDSNPPEESR